MSTGLEGAEPTVMVQRDKTQWEALSSARAYYQQGSEATYLIIKGAYADRSLGVDAILYYRMYFRESESNGKRHYAGILIVGNVHEAVYHVGLCSFADFGFDGPAAYGGVTGFATFLMDPPGPLGAVADIIEIKLLGLHFTKVDSLEPHFAKQVIKHVPLLQNWWTELLSWQQQGRTEPQNRKKNSQ